ncbi:MAG TPA: hypothetical protein DCE55_11910 [Planctomycetaceae bacterium]|nr:hypothetical protein [Planctomycetaceae bacterium]|tara:strand:- start:17 stop:598 length:582 start_codon:yes stop_codon:yes gene_type:complete
MEGSPHQSVCSVAVERKAFLRGIKTAQRTGAIGDQSVRLTFDVSQLRLEFSGYSFQVCAEGRWSGEIHVDAEILNILAKVPPSGDGPIAITLENEQVRIGNIVASCQWNGLEYPRINLPLDAPLQDILCLKIKYSDTDIQRSGLSKTFKDAEEQRDELLSAAARTLRPLGMGSKQLRGLLEERLSIRAARTTW